MVSLDFTFVLFTLTFVVFLFAMKVFFFDPVRAVIDKREAKIKKNVQKANKVKSKIESQFIDHDPSKILTNARSQASAYIDKALSETNANRDELLKNRELELKQKMDKQLQTFVTEFKSLEDGLKGQVTTLVDLILDQIITETTNSIKTTVK